MAVVRLPVAPPRRDITARPPDSAAFPISSLEGSEGSGVIGG
jgi:hypothetical protein